MLGLDTHLEGLTQVQCCQDVLGFVILLRNAGHLSMDQSIIFPFYQSVSNKQLSVGLLEVSTKLKYFQMRFAAAPCQNLL